MANLLDESEGVLGVVLILGVLALGAWLLFEVSGWFGANGDPGKAQSIKNAGNGFPDGADPGTIPAFQYTQGIVESFRNFHDYVFGSDQDDAASDAEATSPDFKEPTQADADNVKAGVDQYNQWALSNQTVPATLQEWALNNLF